MCDNVSPSLIIITESAGGGACLLSPTSTSVNELNINNCALVGTHFCRAIVLLSVVMSPLHLQTRACVDSFIKACQ